METKERKQGIGLGFASLRMLAQKKRQADGLHAKVLMYWRPRPFGSAAVVSLVEEKVDGLIDGVHASAYFRSVCDLHESAQTPEQFSRPAQPFFNGVLAGQERMSDLGHAETAKRLENERY